MRRKLLLTTLVLAAIWGAGPAEATTSAAAVFTVYKVEAETMEPRDGAFVYKDAKGGRMQLPTGSASRTIVVPTGEALVIRARGNACDGAPRMAVFVDGQRVLISNVGATWKAFRTPVTLAAGTHELSARIVNPHRGATCRRAVHIDRVTLESTTATNTGTEGSVCAPTDSGLPFTPPPRHVSTTVLGDAPAYYEAQSPPAAKGLVLLIHGGGWYTAAPAGVAALRSEANRWAAEGWATLAVSSRGCGAWVDDAVWFYDAIAPLVGDLPICASGSSAGGHVALMLASLRPVDCVISRGGPSDLPNLLGQTAVGSTAGPAWLRHLAVAAFGEDRLSEMSPARRAADIGGSVMLATAVTDVFVPLQQDADMAAAVRAGGGDVTVMQLEEGTTTWVHGTVSATAANAFQAAESLLTATTLL